MEKSDDTDVAWLNDDLMLDPNQQNQIKKDYPKLFDVIFWPELQHKFLYYENEAKEFQSKSRRHGFLIIILASASFMAAAFAENTAGFIALAFSSVSVGAFAVAAAFFVWPRILLLFSANPKRRWLQARFAAERLRHLNFQVITRHFDLVIKAADDPAAAESWRETRNKHLQTFDEMSLSNLSTALDTMIADHADRNIWIAPPSGGSVALSDTAVEAKLFELLRKLRLDVQQRYANWKLGPEGQSLKDKARQFDRYMDMSAAFLWISAFLLALTIIWFGSDADFLIGGLAIVIAMSAGAGAAARAWADGLQIEAEAERYTWYKAKIDAFTEDYEESNASEKLRILRNMEAAAYQETRRFLETQEKARFLPMQ